MIQPRTRKKELLTPLRYPGGKTSLFDFFQEVIESNGLKDVTYIEPYAGGAGSAIALLLLNKVNRIVINDYDSAIYAFWHSVVNETEAFVKMIRNTPLNVNEWSRQKQIYKNPESNTLLDLGFATFYLNRTNRSGILNGGPIGGLGQSGLWKIDARFNKEKLISKIELIAKHKDKIEIRNKDGVEIIEEYSNDPSVLFYIDPPYFEKGSRLYLNYFKAEHHAKLAKVLNRLNKAKWILTYDNVESIRNLYSERTSGTFTLQYSAHHSSVASELMLVSDGLITV